MNKKVILGIGTLAVASLPVTGIVACNSKQTKKQKEGENPSKKI